MFTLLLGMDVLISGWITAHLLALIATSFLMRTAQLNWTIEWLKQVVPGQFFNRNSRRVTFLLIVALLGGILSVVMSLQPVKGGLLASILKNFHPPSKWSRYYFLLDDLLIAFGILILLALIPLINRLFSRIHQTIDEWRHTRFRIVRIQSVEIFTPDQLANLLITVAGHIRFTAILIAAGACMTLIFSLYPETEGLARALLDQVTVFLMGMWEKILTFLPNLLTLTVIIFITRLALKLLRFFYNGLHRGRIRYEALHPELVEPTYQLLRFMVITFALVAAFPFIPGSSSPVFRGLSIFIGFLLSLGSTSLVTNIVSGIVLTYTRGLKIGDRVKIEDALGDVIDRTLLVTRVRTIKNVIITIPNAKIMQNQIVNYSTLAQEKGLILHTSVTIGYDVPWRHVHRLLTDAARATHGILADPAPFVLQTSLDDYYISYELNAYTAKPSQMANIYSDLHKNIQDYFNREQVEIMSPSYFAFRDGQKSTVPEMGFSSNGKSQGLE